MTRLENPFIYWPGRHRGNTFNQIIDRGHISPISLLNPGKIGGPTEIEYF